MAVEPSPTSAAPRGVVGDTGPQVESLLAIAPAVLLSWDATGACTSAAGAPPGGPGEPRPGADPAGGAEGWQGDGWLRAIHPDDAPRAVDLVQSVLAGEPALDESVRLPSGFRWAVLRALRHPDGGATGVLVDASRSVGDTARIARLSEGFNRLRLPEEIVRSVLDEGLAMLGGITASIHVLSETGDELVVAGASGVPEELLERWSGHLPLDAPLPACEVFRTGETIMIRSPAERRRRFPQLDVLLPIPYSPSFVVVPLLDAESRPFGVLGVGFADERDLPPRQRAFLADVAAQCALALDRARLTSIAERHAQRLGFINELNEALSSSLELESTLTTLAAMTVPRLADWCVVRLAGPSGDPRPVIGAAHRDPELTADLVRLALKIPRELDRTGELGAALAAGRTLLRHTGGAEVFAPLFPDDGPLLAAIGVESVAVYPLEARRGLLGALAFGNRPGRPMGPHDLDLAGPVVARASTLVDNARMFHEQSAVARALQDSLLPGSLPAIPGLELGARYRAAGRGLDVGGDFYDAFRADANWWIVAVGDVCGHGVEAAALTGLVRHTIRASAMAGAMPSAILARLNEMLLRHEAERSAGDPGDVPMSPRFCTVLVGAVRPTPQGVDLVLCLAGHPRPLVRRDTGVTSVGQPGTLLGVTGKIQLTDAVVHLDAGEALVCFTDGLIDRRRPDGVFGEEGIARALERGRGLAAGDLAGLVESEAVAFVDDEPTDDMAVLTLVVSPRS